MGDADNEIKRLIAELRYDSPNGHYTAAKALVALGEVVTPALIDVLENSWLENERASAAFALGELKAGVAVPALIDALELGANDPPTTVTEHALDALEKIRTRDALAAVIRWYRDHDDESEDEGGWIGFI
jgi:HEAT repeat protein